MRRVGGNAALALLVAVTATGCSAPRKTEKAILRGIGSWLSAATLPLGSHWRADPPELTAAERWNDGLTIVLPGMDGRSPLALSIAQGLADGGLPGAIVVDDWTTGHWPLCLWHLTDERRHYREAGRIAEFVMRYRHAYPHRPVRLVAHSAGCVVALHALEALPPDANIDAVVFLAAAASPGYDLASALAHTDKLVNFHSRGDAFFLMLGTTLFGSADRVRGFAAGAVGFRYDGPGAEKLVQRKYSFAMLRDFHTGGHIGVTNRVFVARWVAPLLLRTDSNE